MKLRLLISVFIVIISLQNVLAQDTNYVYNTPTLGPSKFQPTFEIGVDVFGLAFLPLVSLVNPVNNFSIRPQLTLTYNAGNLIFFDLAIGYDYRSYELISTDMRDYKLNGYYLKPVVNIATDNRNFYVGFGFLFAAQNESGTATIEGNRFDDFTLDVEHNVNLSAVVFKLGTKIKMTERIYTGFELDFNFGLKPSIDNISGPQNFQRIDYTAGAGLSINNGYKIFAATTFAHLSYVLTKAENNTAKIEKP